VSDGPTDRPPYPGPSMTSIDRISRAQFTGIISLTMALTALAMDLMLPAFGEMRADFGLSATSTEVSGIVTFYFLGLASAQVLYGPISDRFGRKPTLYAGFALYGLGALAATFAPTLGLVFAARFVWGVGGAGPRVVALAIVRDSFRGEEMARVMSFIMSIFVLVPIFAPAVGAGIIAFFPWRALFLFCVLYVGLLALWSRRLPETLHPEFRRPIALRPVWEATKVVVRNRQTFGYTLALTALFGVFTSYLGTSEIIVSEVFGRPAQFPLVFGGIAAVMGTMMLFNAKLIGRFGVRPLTHGVLFAYVAFGVVLVGIASVSDGRPGFWTFILPLAGILAMFGLTLPNVNTIAMDPMGPVAGTASAIIGTVSMAVGAVLGAFLDAAFDGTVRPLSWGFLGYGLLAFAFVLWAERGRLFRPLDASP